MTPVTSATAPTAPGIPGAPAVQALPNNGSTSGVNPNASLQVPQALLVTSNAARSTTADNVAKLQTITTPPATTTTGVKAPTTAAPAPAVDTNYMLQPNEGIDQYNARISTYNASKGSPAVAQPKTNSSTSPTPPGSTTPTTNADGTPDYDSAVASIKDPGLAAQFKSSLQSLDQQAQQAQANITSLQGATAATDPATQAAVAAITAKYDQQIALMKAKNTQLLGRASTSVAAFGGLGQMSQSFLTNEQADADQRISTLQDQEQSAILKAQAAFATGNAKALNDAMTEYDNVNSKKLTALNDLLSASNKAIASAQAQAKIDAAAEKQSVTLDISKSTNLGAAIAKNISDAGLTDADQISQYIASVAQEYGITNPDILSSAVTKAQQTADKTASTIANQKDTITNRDTNTQLKVTKQSTTPNGKFVVSTAISKVEPQMKSIAGSDGYIDPQKWVAARDNWMNLGGTAASFKSNFIQYLNPQSYPLAGYKAPTSTTAPVYTTK